MPDCGEVPNNYCISCGTNAKRLTCVAAYGTSCTVRWVEQVCLLGKAADAWRKLQGQRHDTYCPGQPHTLPLPSPLLRPMQANGQTVTKCDSPGLGIVVGEVDTASGCPLSFTMAGVPYYWATPQQALPDPTTATTQCTGTPRSELSVRENMYSSVGNPSSAIDLIQPLPIFPCRGMHSRVWVQLHRRKAEPRW